MTLKGLSEQSDSARLNSLLTISFYLILLGLIVCASAWLSVRYVLLFV